MAQKLFEPAMLGSLKLTNRIVMAPMTRSRAIDNIPNELMAGYYAQRAGAGLLITEGTSPSPNGTGYARIPGIYYREQVEGWKLVTRAVHDKGAKIFLQLMHTGRISHSLNMEAGAEILAPSAVRAAGQMYTDASGMQDFPVPKQMSAEDIQQAINEFTIAAKNAVEAGFDGVEIHGANGYLVEQFLAPNTNVRTDEYGGTIEKRSRFLVEVVQAVANGIGKEKTGIRLSPYGVASDIVPYPEEQAAYIAGQLNTIGIVYVHLVNHSSLGAPEVKASVIEKIRNAFKGSIILSGGYDAARAEEDIESGRGQLIAFGRPFISNPDLQVKLKTNATLAQPDFNTFYTPGAKGYTDYIFSAQGVLA